MILPVSPAAPMTWRVSAITRPGCSVCIVREIVARRIDLMYLVPLAVNEYQIEVASCRLQHGQSALGIWDRRSRKHDMGVYRPHGASPASFIESMPGWEKASLLLQDGPPAVFLGNSSVEGLHDLVEDDLPAALEVATKMAKRRSRSIFLPENSRVEQLGGHRACRRLPGAQACGY